MTEIGIERIEVLSDPNRLVILSLPAGRGMVATISQPLGPSAQNAQYRMKELMKAGPIMPTRTELVGNLVEKHYRSAFELGIRGNAAGVSSGAWPNGLT